MRRAAILALAVSAAFVVVGPSIGELRSWMRAAFPGWFGVVANAALAVAVAAALVAALARIRTDRALRFGLIAAAVTAAAASAAALASASAAQNAVERFHFVQYGLVTWLWYRVVRAASPDIADASVFAAPALSALTVAAADEAMQWFVPERVGEYRDIFLNATAIAAGLLWSAGIDLPRPFTRSLPRPSRRRVAFAAAAALVGIAGFVHMAQLGSVVRDDESRVAFASRWTGDELRALSADRAARWKVTPPPMQVRRYSREDQYLAEALWHIRARNDAWAVDVRRAWDENQILERYFSPALDTPSYAAGVSRWPGEQRADAARRRDAAQASDPAPHLYESRANPLEIHAFSPVWLWGVVGPALAVLAAWVRGGTNVAPRLVI